MFIFTWFRWFLESETFDRSFSVTSIVQPSPCLVFAKFVFQGHTHEVFVVLLEGIEDVGSIDFRSVVEKSELGVER
jgi:hypothetical protein